MFVESNYYRNTNKPMMISMQGTDIAADPKGKGTFSGENGGMIKAYGKFLKNVRDFVMLLIRMLR